MSFSFTKVMPMSLKGDKYVKDGHAVYINVSKIVDITINHPEVHDENIALIALDQNGDARYLVRIADLIPLFGEHFTDQCNCCANEATKWFRVKDNLIKLCDDCRLDVKRLI